MQQLVREAETDLEVVWRNSQSAQEAAAALHDILPALIDAYGQAAATAAAEWYNDLRTSQGVGGRFEAMPEDIPDAGAHALVGWAQSEATDDKTFRTLVEGGMQRRIVNFSRGTVTTSAVRDRSARGWQRVGSGECDFCIMLISRGAVYAEATADFGAHDHCKCSAVPAWEDREVPVKPYVPTNRNIGDADRARVRDWIASH